MEYNKHSSYIKIVARNTLNQPVEIKSFHLNGIEYLASDIVLNKTKAVKLSQNTNNVILAPNRWLSDTPRNDVYFKIPLSDTFDEINSSSIIYKCKSSRSERLHTKIC